MQCAIIGYPGSGKKTLFSLLSGKDMLSRAPGETMQTVIEVPERRLDQLETIQPTEKKTFPRIEFHLLPDLSPKGDNEKPLQHIRNADVLAMVVASFGGQTSEEIHSTVQSLESELAFYDLAQVEKRFEKLSLPGKKSSPPQQREKDMLKAMIEHLEQGLGLRSLPDGLVDMDLFKGFRFASAKSVLVIENVSESSLDGEPAISPSPGLTSMRFGAEIEKEIASLEPEEASAFMKEYNLAESGRNRLVRTIWDLTGMITFLTMGPKEIRAWPIENGLNAAQAAGKIHSDFEKHFIKAEVVRFEDMMKAGSEAEAKKAGTWKLEGRKYMVRDGDVILFRTGVG